MGKSASDVMGMLRRQRGVPDDRIHAWRAGSTNPKYLASELNSVFLFCCAKGIHPRGLDGATTARYLAEKGLGEAGTAAHKTAINTIRLHCFNLPPVNTDADVRVEASLALKRTAEQRRHSGGTAAPRATKKSAQDIPLRDFKALFDMYRAEIERAAGDPGNLPLNHFLQCFATALKADTQLRGTGMRNLPHYKPERIPASAKLTEASTWYVQSVDTKEVILRKKRGYCDKIEITQDPKSEDPTRLSRLWLVLEGKLTDPAQGGRAPSESRLYGKSVFADHLLVPRLGKQKGKDCRWIFGDTLQATTIHNWIAAGAKRLGWATLFQASHVRHLSATYFALGWARRAESKFSLDDLRRRMRHSSETTTTSHYVQAEMHPAVLARWDAMGYDKVALLTTTELVRG
jgi:hypothetical protein